MRVDILIENALLEINGGNLTGDNNVLREDLLAYLPAAISQAVKRAYAEAVSTRNQGRRRATFTSDLAEISCFTFYIGNPNIFNFYVK